jgi:hypothetical protein
MEYNQTGFKIDYETKKLKLFMIKRNIKEKSKK